MKANFFESILKSFLFRFSFDLVRTTNLEDIKLLFQKICPIQTNFSLIRVGGSHDGGYLFPSQVGLFDAIFSPGVGNNSNFEKYFADQGIPCYLLDKSVESPPVNHNNFIFSQLWLSHENRPGESITLKKWVEDSKYESSNNLLLQMDIEGSEYDCLFVTEKNFLNHFKVIIIELHDLHGLFNRARYPYIESAINKLTANHTVIHFHINNCCKPKTKNGILFPQVAELTLVRKDLIKENLGFNTGKHPLEMSNVEKKSYFFDWKKIFS